MRGVFALALATGCGFTTPGELPGDAPAGSNGGPIPIDACTSFSRQLDTCSANGPDLTLSGMNVLNTDTGILASESGPVAITQALVTTATNAVEVRAVYVGTLTFSANAQLRATGSRPLALVARGTVYLLQNALIDVSVGGAGTMSACSLGAAKGQDDVKGAGGGGGGGFGAIGGTGGNGNGDTGPSMGGAPGVASPLPLGPRGGCPGAVGGTGADPGGEPGAGGGAIYVVSATEIQLLGGAVINAGGGGGGGGKKVNSQYGDAGGGGGGSGGMILLEAPKIRSGGVLAANGGGGGEGSGNGSAGRPGAPGTLDDTRAPGGAGGGGGGVGFIRIVSPDAMLGATVSPPAT